MSLRPLAIEGAWEYTPRQLDDDRGTFLEAFQAAPLAETTGNRGGIHNSLTRLLVKPSHLAGGFAQMSFSFNYLGPTGNQRDEITMVRKRSQEVQY